jgi:hypothetical protein
MAKAPLLLFLLATIGLIYTDREFGGSPADCSPPCQPPRQPDALMRVEENKP